MSEHAREQSGMDDAQSEQLPSLADRPIEEIEAVAEVLVEVRSISSQLQADEVRDELSARLDRVGVRLPAGDLHELVDQLVPTPEGEAHAR